MRLNLDLSDLQRTIAKESRKKKENYLKKKAYKKSKGKFKPKFYQPKI
jgi:hypothetical protein